MGEKGHQCMVLQPSLRALQSVEITRTLNRWILNIWKVNLLPQTFHNTNWHSDGYNNKNSNNTNPCNTEDKKIEQTISRTSWRDITAIIKKWNHCREHYTNTENYKLNLLHTNSANSDTVITTYTPMSHTIKQTRIILTEPTHSLNQKMAKLS